MRQRRVEGGVQRQQEELAQPFHDARGVAHQQRRAGDEQLARAMHREGRDDRAWSTCFLSNSCHVYLVASEGFGERLQLVHVLPAKRLLKQVRLVPQKQGQGIQSRVGGEEGKGQACEEGTDLVLVEFLRRH